MVIAASPALPPPPFGALMQLPIMHVNVSSGESGFVVALVSEQFCTQAPHCGLVDDMSPDISFVIIATVQLAPATADHANS
jgi:hypothetical protein